MVRRWPPTHRPSRPTRLRAFLESHLADTYTWHETGQPLTPEKRDAMDTGQATLNRKAALLVLSLLYLALVSTTAFLRHKTVQTMHSAPTATQIRDHC